MLQVIAGNYKNWTGVTYKKYIKSPTASIFTLLVSYESRGSPLLIEFWITFIAALDWEISGLEAVMVGVRSGRCILSHPFWIGWSRFDWSNLAGWSGVGAAGVCCFATWQLLIYSLFFFFFFYLKSIKYTPYPQLPSYVYSSYDVVLRRSNSQNCTIFRALRHGAIGFCWFNLEQKIPVSLVLRVCTVAWNATFSSDLRFQQTSSRFCVIFRALWHGADGFGWFCFVWKLVVSCGSGAR